MGWFKSLTRVASVIFPVAVPATIAATAFVSGQTPRQSVLTAAEASFGLTVSRAQTATSALGTPSAQRAEQFVESLQERFAPIPTPFPGGSYLEELEWGAPEFVTPELIGEIGAFAWQTAARDLGSLGLQRMGGLSWETGAQRAFQFPDSLSALSRLGSLAGLLS